MTVAKKLKFGLIIVAMLVLAVAAFLRYGPLKIGAFSVLLNALSGSGIAAPEQSVWQSRLLAPEGFSISVYADKLPMVRFMAVTGAGDLILSRPRAGEVMLLGRDANGDGLPDSRRVLLAELSRPHGLALKDGWLYIAESNAIGRVAIDEDSGVLDGVYERIVVDLPDSGNHWTKTIGFGPDGMLYLSIGSSCNVCIEEDERRATMMRFAADGSDAQIVATGLRNSVGFDWAPWSGDLYATDNGRDLLGDDFPPCELNRVVEGGFYGWPFINGLGQLDPDYGDKRPDVLAAAINPVFSFAAHNAPLGMTFLSDTSGLPERSALVALHGSWNRSSPDGYKVVLLSWQSDASIVASDFVAGFELDGDIIGRPADVVQGPAGDIYVSDDYAGVIYRISRGSSVVAAQGAVKQESLQVLAGIEEAQLELLVAEGRELYAEHNCASCHQGEGSKLLVLDQLPQKYDWQTLVSLLETPTPPMPRFALTQHQQKALAVYLLRP